MNTLIIIILGLATLLFMIKLVYVLCAAVVLRSTRGALYVSTTRKRIAASFDALRIRKGSVWIDLGCGDGRILRAVKKRFKVSAIGYEINLMAYIKARLISMGHPDIQIRLKDFFKVDLSQADTVSCYLFPDVMPDLAHKLKAELRPGTRVVSFNFPLPGFNPEQVLRPPGSLHSDPIFIYRI